jgi:Na+/H+ antiporter NhaD/arsenite permease-like protein
MDLTVLIFLITYLAIAIGRVPFFRVDRTGAALLGAIALIATDRIGLKAAWDAVSFSTVALLFGLMVVSSAFAVAGFYDWAAVRIASLKVGPKALLAVFVTVSGALSAILTNDVVVLAMTPLLVQITLSRGLNPVPFLLGFCFAANTASSGTLIGSPQNMIIADGLHLSFPAFIRVAGIPSLLSVPIIWAAIAVLYRGRWVLDGAKAPAARSGPVEIDVMETAKAALVTVVVVAAFMFTGWPHAIVALAGAGVLLLNRRIASSDLMKNVDGDLLLLLFCLFVVNAALAATGLPAALLKDLAAAGFDLNTPLTLFATLAVASDIVGNNPAVMLVMPYVGTANPEASGAAMALGSGFSSNLFVFGSLAGIIVVQAAGEHGIRIGFGEFTRAGLAATIPCLVLAAAWVMLL